MSFYLVLMLQNINSENFLKSFKINKLLPIDPSNSIA